MKAEPVDPLAMDMGEDEVDYEPDRLNEEVRDSDYGSRSNVHTMKSIRYRRRRAYNLTKPKAQNR